MKQSDLKEKIERFEKEKNDHLKNNRPVSAAKVQKSIDSLKTHLEE